MTDSASHAEICEALEKYNVCALNDVMRKELGWRLKTQGVTLDILAEAFKHAVKKSTTGDPSGLLYHWCQNSNLVHMMSRISGLKDLIDEARAEIGGGGATHQYNESGPGLSDYDKRTLATLRERLANGVISNPERNVLADIAADEARFYGTEPPAEELAGGAPVGDWTPEEKQKYAPGRNINATLRRIAAKFTAHQET